MLLKLDENMPTDLIDLLQAIGHNAQTCLQEGIAGTGDPAISAHATKESRILLTFDLDFADIRAFPPGTHAGIIVLRLKSHDLISVESALARVFATISVSDFAGNLIIADNRRVRSRRPQTTP